MNSKKCERATLNKDRIRSAEVRYSEHKPAEHEEMEKSRLAERVEGLIRGYRAAIDGKFRSFPNTKRLIIRLFDIVDRHEDDKQAMEEVFGDIDPSSVVDLFTVDNRIMTIGEFFDKCYFDSYHRKNNNENLLTEIDNIQELIDSIPELAGLRDVFNYHLSVIRSKNEDLAIQDVKEQTTEDAETAASRTRKEDISSGDKKQPEAKKGGGWLSGVFRKFLS